MNSFLIKAGIFVVAAVGIQIYFMWRNRKHEQASSYSSGSYGNYDGSNMKSCCICLNEFSTFLKHQVVTFPCLHKICIPCCKQLFSEKIDCSKICPQCRKPIPEAIFRSFS